MEQKTPSTFMNVVTWISRVMAYFASISVGAMMFLSVADVCGRRFFLHPIEGTTEIVGLLLVIASCLGFGWCQLIKGNIRIDFISNYFPRRGQISVLIFSYIICTGISALVAWRGWLVVLDYMSKTVGGVTPLLGVKIWPFMLLLSIGFGWVAFIFIIDLFNSFVEVFKQ